VDDLTAFRIYTMQEKALFIKNEGIAPEVTDNIVVELEKGKMSFLTAKSTSQKIKILKDLQYKWNGYTQMIIGENDA